MNYSTAVFLINKSVRAIAVTYEPEKSKLSYTFKSLDQSLKIDDYVIIPTDTRHCMTVGRVSGVDVDFDIDGSFEMKWLIGKVDKEAYDTVLAQEQVALTRIKSAEKTRKRNELAEALLKVIANFANPDYWIDEPGRLQWTGKRHAIEYALSTINENQ